MLPSCVQFKGYSTWQESRNPVVVTSHHGKYPVNMAGEAGKSEVSHTIMKKVLAALLFGVCSFVITIVNKVVLTTYK